MKKATTIDDNPSSGTEPRRSKQALRKQAEARLAQSPDIPESLSPEEIRERLHELRVHQIELEMQNEELRRAQTEIEAGRARYFELYDLAPVGYCTLSEQGLILEANLTAATLLGTTRGALLKRPLSHFIVKEDQDIYYLHRKKLFESHSTSSGQAGEAQECELRLLKADGAVFWAHLTATVAQAEDGAPVCRLVLSDITERKRLEYQLADSSKEYRDLSIMFETIFDAIPDVIGIQELNHRVIRYNKAGYAYFKLSPEMVHGKNCFELIGRETPCELCATSEVYETKKPALIEKYIPEISRWIEIRAFPVIGEDGNATKVIELLRDITEHKRAVNLLQESEARYRGLLENIEAGVVVHAPDTSIIMHNSRAAELLGLSDEQMKGKLAIDPAWHFIDENGNPYLIEEYPVNKIVSKRQAIRDLVLGIIRPASNDLVWVSVNGIPVLDRKGEIFEIVISFVDITQRKMAEQAMQRKEHDLSESQRIAHVGTWRLDIASNHVVWTEELYKMYGFDPSLPPPPYSEHKKLFTPESWERLSTSLARTRDSGLPYELELETVRKDGSNGWMWVRGEADLDSAGKTLGLWGVAQDITERKRTEQELARNASLLRDVLDMVPVYICAKNSEGRFLLVNQKLADFYGIPIATMTGMLHADLCEDKEELQNMLAADRQVMEGGKSIVISQETMKKPDGSIAVLETYKIPFTADNKPAVLIASADITERKRAEESLRETTIQLQESVRAANVGLWDWNLVSNRVHYSHEWKRQIGYDDAEIADAFEEWESRLHPEDLASTLEKIRKAIIGDSRRYQAEFRFRHKDSSYRWIVAQCSVLRDETGKAVRVVGSHVDLTEYKQTQDALRREHEWLGFVIEGASLGTWEWNVQTNETVFNETWAEILGYTHDELTPCNYDTWASLLHPDDLAIAVERLRRCAAGEMTEYECEFRMRHKDGRWIWILDRGRMMTHDASGAPLSMFGTHTDITHIKEAVEALRESEARFRGYVEHAPYGVFVTDGQGRYVDVNPAAERISGYSAAQLTSMSIPDLLADESRENGLTQFQDLLRTGRLFTELAFRSTDGSRRDWSVSATRIGADRYLGFVEDITERKRAEDERDQLQTRLTQAQKMESVGRLAGGVAHDFNNMLSIIIGYSDMILGQMAPGQPFHPLLMEISKAGKRSADLTRQLLAFARKQTVSPKLIDLNQTVEGALKMLQRLIGEDISIVWSPGVNLWQIKIDPSQIDQILANLCINARDAIAGVGKMTIETCNTSFDESYCKDHPDFSPGEYAMLAVSDNGCGMDSETLSHLFEPFFTTKEMGKGTGLGLATVYGVVKQNNGFINVYSAPSQGATFKIYLPRHVTKTAPLPEKEPDKPSRRGHETILLVEDEPAILKMTTTLLEQEGYTVLPAGTPGEAVRLANEHAGEIHLLMTDVVMPEMNGRDLAKNIMSLYPRLKCIFMSGYTADVIAHRGILDEGVSFIQKPFSLDDLSTKLRAALHRD